MMPPATPPVSAWIVPAATLPAPVAMTPGGLALLDQRAEVGREGRVVGEHLLELDAEGRLGVGVVGRGGHVLDRLLGGRPLLDGRVEPVPDLLGVLPGRRRRRIDDIAGDLLDLAEEARQERGQELDEQDLHRRSP